MIEYMSEHEISKELATFVGDGSLGLSEAVAQRYVAEYGRPQGYFAPRAGATSSCKVTDIGIATLSELTYRAFTEYGKSLLELSSLGDAFVSLAARCIVQAARAVPVATLTPEKADVLATALHICVLGSSVGIDELAEHLACGEERSGRWAMAYPHYGLLRTVEMSQVRLSRYMRLLVREGAMIQREDGWSPVASDLLDEALGDLVRQHAEGVS